ncbi:TnsA endonuclease N-terminal domain-containing protein [Variovorax sp. J31P207]|uniref:TnsA endonuclease N-terminal domain-containing protein n=1 Tax=Variovorax sp. J31P207 TaxID=3053510 RepID=UPI00257887A5|nr:TnsA endonuclease N-terminal domain-containing protein [Variovorax sp. J31P207]MDM0068783.1 TnsA endonuclease N-terminal domain-containing protein [Variovorax sp. J31P207]
MTRLRYSFDEARVQRFIAEGRGAGMGASYLPWLQIQDVPSSGRSHRPFGVKSKRVHHLLSDGEWKCFLKLEADTQVEEIREQFPMDRFETFRLAQKLGLRHPRTLDGTPYVMTLDFLVTIRMPGGQRLVPYTFKYDPETLSPREQELMDITRAFWHSHAMELQLIDQGFFDEPFNLNYDSVRGYYDISQFAFIEVVDVSGLVQGLLQEVLAQSEASLAKSCRMLAGSFHTTPNVVYQIAMHLVARGSLRVDLSSPVGLELLPMHAYATTPAALEHWA